MAETKNKSKSNIKYYLRINDKIIIDFTKVDKFKDMDLEDYLNLNIFISNFKDQDELVQTLKKINLLDKKEIVDTIEIVRRRKNNGYNHESQYWYEYITDNLLFSDGIIFLSKNKLEKFLLINRYEFDFIDEVMNYYENPTKKKHAQKKKNLEYLQHDYASLDKIEKAEHSVSFFERQKDIISKIKRYRHRHYDSVEQDSEYEELLNNFLSNELEYHRNKKTTNNNLGILKMTKLFANLYKKYPTLKFPGKKDPFEKDRKTYINILSSIEFEIYEQELANREDMDPDQYMLLESEDFDRLRSEFDKEIIKESIDADIEVLEERQNRHK